MYKALSFLAFIFVGAAGQCTDNLNGGVRQCCPTTGECQSSSCTVFGFSNSAKSNCRTGSNSNCPYSYCNLKVSNCTQKCYGTVACQGGGDSCYGYGSLCLQNGASGNYKICSDSALSGGESGCCCKCGGSLYGNTACTGTPLAGFDGSSMDITSCAPLFSGATNYFTIAACSNGNATISLYNDSECNGTATNVSLSADNCISTGITSTSFTYALKISCYASAAASIHACWLLAMMCAVFLWVQH